MNKRFKRASQRWHLHAFVYGSAFAVIVVPPFSAWSEEIYAPPPPSPTQVVDANGINLISASPTPHMPALSTAGLSETMGNVGVTWRSGVTDYNDSFVGYISDFDRNSPSSSGPGNPPIVVGSKGFQLGVDIFAGDCVSSICTYWDKDGVAYLFDATKASEAFDGVASKRGMLVQINKPDGEAIKVTLIKASLVFTTPGGTNNQQYTVHQIATYYPSNVVSSTGWMAKYEYTTRSYSLSASGTAYTAYVPQKIYLINTAVDYCDIVAPSCTSSNAVRWPTWNITYPDVYKDASSTLLGYYGPNGYTTPSGLSHGYSFGMQTHRVTDAYFPGMHTTYAYSWADGSLGSAPYIITATKPDNNHYSIRSENANWQYTLVGSGDLLYYSLVYLYVNQPSSFTDEDGRVTKYEYNSDNTAYRADNRSLKRVITPEATYSGSTLTGGFTEYGYDGRRNMTSVAVYPKGGGTPLISSYEYEATCTSGTYIYCNKPKKITDPKGNVTTFIYSTVHGQVLTETKTADAAGVQPQTRYTYTALYPKSLNAAGSLVPAATPVYRLTKTSSCRTATAANAASCVGTDQETVTEYAYANDNLLLTKTTVRAGNANVANVASATNVWATTSYTYDDVGNRTSVDGPLPGTVDQTITMYDVLRRPVYEMGVDPDGGSALPRVIVHHLYDIDGREYRTETGWGYGSLVLACSVTATTCANYNVTSYVQRTYDATTGLEVKSITAVP